MTFLKKIQFEVDYRLCLTEEHFHVILWPFCPEVLVSTHENKWGIYI